jgi:hypothetical protein
MSEETVAATPGLRSAKRGTSAGATRGRRRLKATGDERANRV